MLFAHPTFSLESCFTQCLPLGWLALKLCLGQDPDPQHSQPAAPSHAGPTGCPGALCLLLSCCQSFYPLLAVAPQLHLGFIPKLLCSSEAEKYPSEVLEVFTPLSWVFQAGNPCTSLHVGHPAYTIPAISHGGGRERKENKTSFWCLLPGMPHTGLSQNGFHWTSYLWGLPELEISKPKTM